MPGFYFVTIIMITLTSNNVIVIIGSSTNPGAADDKHRTPADLLLPAHRFVIPRGHVPEGNANTGHPHRNRMRRQGQQQGKDGACSAVTDLTEQP